MKQTLFTDTLPYLLQRELDSLKEEMAYAMQHANTNHVKSGQLTLRMRETLLRYFDWAQRASEAGL